MLPATRAREKQWAGGPSVFPSPPSGAFDGAGGSQWVWSLESRGELGGQQAAVPPLHPVTPSWVMSSGEAGTCHRSGGGPPSPAVAFGRCGGAGLLLSGTRCRVLHGASEMRRWDFVQVPSPKRTYAHIQIHYPQEDLHSCAKGTPPSPKRSCSPLWCALQHTLMKSGCSSPAHCTPGSTGKIKFKRLARCSITLITFMCLFNSHWKGVSRQMSFISKTCLFRFSFMVWNDVWAPLCRSMVIKTDVFLHLCMCTVPLRCVWLLPWIDPVGIGSALESCLCR